MNHADTNEDLAVVAYRAAHEAAWECVEAVLRNLKSETGRDDLSSGLSQAVGDMLIYDSDVYACLWGLPDHRDVTTDLDMRGTMPELIRAQACLNLEDAVTSHRTWPEVERIWGVRP